MSINAICLADSPPIMFPVPSPAVPALRRIPAAWLMLVAQLDRSQFDFSIGELAELMPIQSQSLRKHARQLWPHRGSPTRYRLEWADACVLLNLACTRCTRIDEKKLFSDLTDQGFDLVGFQESLSGLQARRAIHLFRERRGAAGHARQALTPTRRLSHSQN